VAEIDPAVTRANQRPQASKDTSIKTNGDARQFVEKDPGPQEDDLILGDAFNDFSVPWPPADPKFNEKSQMMFTDGVYH